MVELVLTLTVIFLNTSGNVYARDKKLMLLCVNFLKHFANVMQGLKNEATSKLNSVYEEIRPTIEEHGRDNQDSVPTSVAETWIEAHCSKYKADFDLYFSVIKNVMHPRPATYTTAAAPSEGGAVPQMTNAEPKLSQGAK